MQHPVQIFCILTFVTFVSAIRIPFIKDTFNIPAYLYKEGSATHLRFLNYHMTLSKVPTCRCSYTKLQAPFQPLVPDPKHPLPYYLRANLTTVLEYCLNFQGCTINVLEVLRGAGANLERSINSSKLSNSARISFGDSTFKLKPYKVQEMRRRTIQGRNRGGRTSFIPSLRRMNRYLPKVFRKLSLFNDVFQNLYWYHVRDVYRRHHWVPRSKIILRARF